MTLALVFLPLLLGAAVGAWTGMDRAWYDALEKPIGTPPGWVFGPVWTVMYLLMGVVLYRIVRFAKSRWILPLFLLQLALNLAWTPVFFGRRDVRLALTLIVALVATLSATIVALYAAGDVTSAALLLPYLAWVLYATRLNYGILTKNNF